MPGQRIGFSRFDSTRINRSGIHPGKSSNAGNYRRSVMTAATAPIFVIVMVVLMIMLALAVVVAAIGVVLVLGAALLPAAEDDKEKRRQ